MILGIGTTTEEQQKTIHAGEAFEIWQHLVMRYDVQEMISIFQNFANDVEFKSFLTLGLSILDKIVAKLENEMDRLGVPLPKRPPRSINTPANTEILRDETMFRTINLMVQLLLQQLQRTEITMIDPRLREMVAKMKKTESELYSKMLLYGRLKGWLHFPPQYRG